MSLLYEVFPIVEAAIRIRVLDQGPEDAVEVRRRLLGQVLYSKFDPQGFSATFEHGQGLWMTTIGDHEDGVLASAEVEAHDHGFGSSGRLVEQGGVRDRKTREITHHGLEIQEAASSLPCEISD